MEVKDIISKISKKEEKKEYFFALIIAAEKVRGSIWTVEAGKTKVVATGEPESWAEEKGLLNAVDATLSSATEAFTPPEEVKEPNKIVFGLPETWVEEEKITAEKLKILKEVSQKLDLKPVGFVVTTEAMVHQLKVSEGVPPTAILLGLEKEEVRVTLVGLGKIEALTVVKRSENLGADVAEGLSRLGTKKSFPARMLLYNAEKDLEKAKEELLAHSWPSFFLHLPKVEILSADFDIRAVALSGGREVAKAAGIEVFEPEVKKKEEEIKEEASLPAEEPKVEEPETKKKEEVDFGFVKDKDVVKERPPEPVVVEAPKVEPEIAAPLKKEREEIVAPSPEKKRLPTLKLPKIDFSKLPFPKIDFSKLATTLSLSQFKGRTPLVIGLVLGLFFVLGGIAIGVYWYLPRAQVTLLVEPKTLEKKFEIKLDPELSTPNPAALALPVDSVDAEVEGEKTVGTTGTKLVGDPAKGEVTIFNRTEGAKEFTAGTVIIGPGDLEFALDDEVTVASESAGPDYTKVPGKATVSVTAVEIGTEGNLAAESEFSIADYSSSDYIARNGSAFTGGTSREVSVVSEKDQEDLLSALTEELEQKATDELNQKLSPDTKLLEESLTDKVVEKGYSKKTGEESDELSLSLKSKFSALTYKEEDFKGLVEDQIRETVPSGFEFKKEESEISFDLVEVEEDGSARFTATLKANLLPKIDLEEIRKNLAGKYPELGELYLDNLPNVVGFEAKITPHLPRRLETFPRLAKNIQIEVKLK
jgi:hypothetical protein